MKFPGDPGETWNIDPPVIQIETWPSERKGNYTHWDCDSDLVMSEWLQSDGQTSEDGRVTNQSVGFCMAGKGYVWGFSFILTFLVSVLHLVFTALMYGIWLMNTRTVRSGKKQGLFSHATFLVTSVQRQYGGEISDWTPERLEQEIVKG